MVPEAFRIAIMHACNALHEFKHAEIGQDDMSIPLRKEDALRQHIKALVDPLVFFRMRTVQENPHAHQQQQDSKRRHQGKIRTTYWQPSGKQRLRAAKSARYHAAGRRP